MTECSDHRHSSQRTRSPRDMRQAADYMYAIIYNNTTRSHRIFIIMRQGYSELLTVDCDGESLRYLLSHKNTNRQLRTTTIRRLAAKRKPIIRLINKPSIRTYIQSSQITLNIFSLTPLFIATGFPPSNSKPASPPSPDIASSFCRSSSSASCTVFGFLLTTTAPLLDDGLPSPSVVMLVFVVVL